MQKSTRLYRIAVALGLGLMFAQLPATHARPKPPLTEQNIFSSEELPQNDTTGNDSLVIKGTVLDEKQKPATGTIVRVSLGEHYLGFCEVDTNGNFEFIIHQSPSPSDFLSVNFTYPGYSTRYLSRKITDNSPINIQFNKLAPNMMTTGEVIRQLPVSKSAAMPVLTPEQTKRITDNSRH